MQHLDLCFVVRSCDATKCGTLHSVSPGRGGRRDRLCGSAAPLRQRDRCKKPFSQEQGSPGSRSRTQDTPVYKHGWEEPGDAEVLIFTLEASASAALLDSSLFVYLLVQKSVDSFIR